LLATKKVGKVSLLFLGPLERSSPKKNEVGMHLLTMTATPCYNKGPTQGSY
jgi:hypothetical protein